MMREEKSTILTLEYLNLTLDLFEAYLCTM